MAFLNKGLTITLEDQRVTREEAEIDAEAESGDSELAVAAKSADDAKAAATQKAARRRKYHYPNGLRDYVESINKTKQALHPSIIAFDAKGEGHEVEIAMQWNNGYSESVHTFANTINTIEGGTHEEGFRSALTSLCLLYTSTLPTILLV